LVKHEKQNIAINVNFGFSYDKVTNVTENQKVKNNKTDTTIANVSLWNYLETCTVKSAHDVTCIKRSPFSSPVIEKFIWIEPLLRGHLSLKTLLLCPKGDLLIQVWLYLLFLELCFKNKIFWIRRFHERTFLYVQSM
jgi:hypothetical protein